MSTPPTESVFWSAASHQIARVPPLEWPDPVEATAILDVPCPNGDPRWASVPVAWRWWRRVQAVGAMGDRLVKGK